jgi:hypothetical protein
MAHFAQLTNGKVGQVIVIANEDCGGGDFPTSEPIGQAFIASIGIDGEWLQTSYHAKFRYNYAGIGYTFDTDKGTDGAFIPPKPFESWVLDEDTCLWEAPVEYPTDGAQYVWDEEAGNWSEVTGE